MPVLARLRAIRPNCRFLKPDISLPPPMKRVARIVPSTVWTVQTAICSLRLRSTADPGICMRGHLSLDLLWSLELLLNRSMQPPLLPSTNERGTSHFGLVQQFAASEAHFEPTPTASCPDFEQDGGGSAFFPLAQVE